MIQASIDRLAAAIEENNRLIGKLIDLHSAKIISGNPPREPSNRETEESRAIQAIVTLEHQTGKLPSVSAVCRQAGINRGVLYKSDRFVKFKAIYEDLKAKYQRQKRATAVRDVRDVRGGFHLAGGGLEAVDDSAA